MTTLNNDYTLTYNVNQKIVRINSLQWLALLGVFFANRIEAVVIMFVCIIFYVKSKKVYTSNILKYFLLVLISSLIIIYIVGYQYSKCIQQIVLLAIFIFSYEQFYKHNKNDMLELFRKYIKLTYIASLFGILQEIVYSLTGINIANYIGFYHSTLPITNHIMRMTSFLSEGGYFGTILIPSLIYLFYYNDALNVLNKKKYIILIASLFTLSPFVYICLSVILLFKIIKAFKYAKNILLVLLIIFVSYGVKIIVSSEYRQESSGIEGIFMRIKDSCRMISMINPHDLYQIANLNSSSAVLASNAYIGFYGPSRLFGTGLGTNAQSHDKLIANSFDQDYAFADLNADDGYSLFNRILSEFGFIGVALYSLFILKHFNRKNDLNKCIFFILICWFLRGGSYVDFGTISAHFFYFYTSKFNFNFKIYDFHNNSNLQCRNNARKMSKEYFSPTK